MANNYIIFDGAMGTMLYNKGFLNECNELLNVNDPDIIADIHKAYAEAGAQYVKTNTFGASPLKLMKSKMDIAAFDINKAAVDIAKKSGVKVAGDIGPSGELYSPFGTVSTLDIYNSFLLQVMALRGSDIILIETMSSLVEAHLAYLAVRSLDRDIPVIISFTFDNGYTMMGCTPEQIAKAFNHLDIFAIGTNCSGGPKELVEVVKIIKSNTIHHIAAMPNAGLPVLVENNVEYPFSAEDFATEMKNIIEAGATVLGGCCGTTPEHIKALIEITDNNNDNKSEIDKTKYIATEREYRSIEGAIPCSTEDSEILSIEESGQIARIDVSDIECLEEFFANLNQLSTIPKCFIAREEQELLIRILYQGITDIVFRCP